jgi:acyl-homoserine lactone acylase PvdQ
VFQVWTEAIARRALAPHLPEDVLRAYLASIETWRTAVLPAMLREAHPWLDDASLTAALDDALEELGDPIPPWGELHRLRLAHPLARIPGLEALFTAVDEPIGGDEQTVAAAGMDGVAGRTAAVIASVRMVWDLADPHAGVPVVASGVSSNVASPHWADQQPTYRDGTSPPAGGGETLTLTP